MNKKKELLYVLRQDKVCFGLILVFGQPVVLKTDKVAQANLYSWREAEQINKVLEKIGLEVELTDYPAAKQKQAMEDLARANKLSYSNRKMLTE